MKDKLEFSIEPKEFKTRILFIRFSSFGDIILASGVVSILKSLYKNSEITWIMGEEFVPVFQGRTLADRVVGINRFGIKGYISMISLAKSLRKQIFDIVVDIQDNRRSAFLLKMLKYNLRTRSMSSLEERGDDHAYYHFSRILKSIGIDKMPKKPHLLFNDLDEEVLNKNLYSLGYKNEPLVTFATSASQSLKRWNVEHFKELAKIIISRNKVSIALIGAKGEEKYGFEGENIYNLIGKLPYFSSILLIKKSKLLVTNDSSPLHMAFSVGTPAVVLYGPTRPNWSLPEGPYFAVQSPLSCSPCMKKSCPKGLNCLDEILPQNVYNVILKNKERIGFEFSV
ncbi:glycosyl transferase family 9 [Thermodesulfobium narugense DSM 14796]|uniref:Glycosyl transferase family 9 n=1 Tax=Thermodesulfobium narugense DSM 14796 TaxID=747365 RepID=M1E8P4_9BACT|nr:glycosyltransferase family 9 protein [Thermodesulfobium narugense]AEE15273.1 glycosyl transferase family 9 [Thermodesulfobium narugense DSM 14796]